MWGFDRLSLPEDLAFDMLSLQGREVFTVYEASCNLKFFYGVEL